MDISNILGNTGVALEARAYQAFGAAVNSATTGALSNLGLGQRAPSNQPVNEFAARSNLPDTDILYQYENTLSTTNYAQAFASGVGGFDPKLKFMFKVSFEFDQDVVATAEKSGYKPHLQHILQRDLGFLVKEVEMPKFKFDYQEFNYYNFRTKILKKVEHDPLSFRMYDDVDNRALAFINIYLKLLAPVHRTPWSTGSNLEDQGFNFNPLDMNSSAQRDVLGSSGNRKNILTKMRVEHFYLRRNDGGSDAATAIRLNTFEFINPRLTSFDLPELNYEDGGDASIISCSFDYDALHIVTGQFAADHAEDLRDTALPGSDILSTMLDGGSNMSRRHLAATRSAGGALKDDGLIGELSDIAGRQLGRGIQEEVANALYRSGMGSIAGGALSGVISSVSGTLGTNASKTLAQAGRSIPVGINLPRQQQIIDSAIGGQFLGKVVSKVNPFSNGGG